MKKFLSLMTLTLTLGWLFVPFATLADNSTYGLWTSTNVTVYVHKSLVTSSTSVSLSKNCDYGTSTARNNVNQTEPGAPAIYCPNQTNSSGNNGFNYAINDKVTKPTASLPYYIYKEPIARSATGGVINSGWYIYVKGLTGRTDAKKLTVKIMNNTVASVNSSGTISGIAPTGTDPYHAPAPTPTETPTPETPGGSTPASGPFTATPGAADITTPTLDETKCPDDSRTNADGQRVYTKGILTDVPCDGAVDSLTEVLAVVKNAVMIFLMPLVGTLFLIMLLLGGILYITSRGNKQQLERAKKVLTAAIIGLLIVTLSYTIIKIFVSTIGGGVV